MHIGRKQNLNDSTSDIVGVGLKYQKVDSGWGLTGFFEGYRLVFSGPYQKQAFSFENLKKLFIPAQPEKNSIITNLDLFKLFSKDAKKAWSLACRFARKHKRQLAMEDIFLALLNTKPVKDLFRRLNVSPVSTKTFIKNYSRLHLPPNDGSLAKIPFEAFALSLKLHNTDIDPLMLLGGLLNSAPDDNVIQAIFSNIELTEEKLELYAVWTLNLNYDFPKNSGNGKLLYCCRQAQGLEEHFGYFFQLPAIEEALAASSNQTLKDLEHKKALQIMVKAAGLAKLKKTKIISQNMIKQIEEQTRKKHSIKILNKKISPF